MTADDAAEFCEKAPYHDPNVHGVCQCCNIEVPLPLFVRDTDPIVAARRAAIQTGIGLTEHQATKIVAAVLSCADGVIKVTRTMPREAWARTEWQDNVRRHLRHELLHKCLTEGVVPTALPTEILTYLQGWPPSTVPWWAVQGGAAWDHIDVSMLVSARRPVVDRIAAVRAGAR